MIGVNNLKGNLEIQMLRFSKLVFTLNQLQYKIYNRVPCRKKIEDKGPIQYRLFQ